MTRQDALDAARTGSPNHVTRHPDSGHRFATVEVRAGSEVVLAAGWLLLRALR